MKNYFLFKKYQTNIIIIFILILVISNFLMFLEINRLKEKNVEITNLILETKNSGLREKGVEKENNLKNSSEDSNKDADENSPEIVVDIKGAVGNPGVYSIDVKTRLNELINKAGGFDLANEECVNLSRTLNDSELIIIPSKDEECQPDFSNNINESNSNTSNLNNSEKININTATKDELLNIPKIGDTKSEAIISYREENNGFKSIMDIKNVSGIGEKTYEEIKDYIEI